jgi:hypothetical protein
MDGIGDVNEAPGPGDEIAGQPEHATNLLG